LQIRSALCLAYSCCIAYACSMNLQRADRAVATVKAELLTYREAALLRGWSEATLRSWALRGHLTVVELAPRKPLLVRAEVLLFVPPALRGTAMNPDPLVCTAAR